MATVDTAILEKVLNAIEDLPRLKAHLAHGYIDLDFIEDHPTLKDIPAAKVKQALNNLVELELLESIEGATGMPAYILIKQLKTEYKKARRAGVAAESLTKDYVRASLKGETPKPMTPIKRVRSDDAGTPAKTATGSKVATPKSIAKTTKIPRVQQVVEEIKAEETPRKRPRTNATAEEFEKRLTTAEEENKKLKEEIRALKQKLVASPPRSAPTEDPATILKGSCERVDTKDQNIPLNRGPCPILQTSARGTNMNSLSETAAILKDAFTKALPTEPVSKLLLCYMTIAILGLLLQRSVSVLFGRLFKSNRSAQPRTAVYAPINDEERTEARFVGINNLLSQLNTRLEHLEQTVETAMQKIAVTNTFTATSTTTTSISSCTSVQAATMPPPPPPPPPLVMTTAPVVLKKVEAAKAEVPKAAEAAEPSMSDVLRELSRVQRKVVDMISSPRSTYLHRQKNVGPTRIPSKLAPSKLNDENSAPLSGKKTVKSINFAEEDTPPFQPVKAWVDEEESIVRRLRPRAPGFGREIIQEMPTVRLRKTATAAK
ncbi:hypothetical protein HDV05_008497 [Chytridiales sp. JEL 0842]|nr:hypothetical protein HDV05_008497 [Chytridiales sp. JEL 0842]